MTPGISRITDIHSRSFPIRSVIADVLLAGLVLGPLAAPFLAAAGIFPLPGIAGIIYTMGMYVCPQPAHGLMLMPPHIMAVCMRCYGVVLGLLATRLFYAQRGGAGRMWLTQYGYRGATLMGVLILAYPAEFAGQVSGLWGFDNSVVTLFGLITGVALGLFFMPVLHGRSGK